MAAQVGVRVTADTGAAQGQIKALSGSVEELSEKLKEATEAGNWKEAADITLAINNLSSAQKTQSQMAKEGQAGGAANGASPLGQQLANVANALSGVVSQIARGDIAGAVAGGLKGGGSFAVDAGKALMERGDTGLGKAMQNLGFFAQIVGAAASAANALSEQYEHMLPTMVDFNREFTPDTFSSAKKRLEERNPPGVAITDEDVIAEQIRENTSREMSYFNRATDMAEGTGLETDAFMKLAKDESLYGVEGDTPNQRASNAMNYARSTALLAYGTGVDAGELQKFVGLNRRFGGSEDAGKTAYGGLIQSGMDKGQFSEYLNAVEDVLESSISKGFISSTEEVAKNLNMLSASSGNSAFFQGKEGAKKLINMNNALSNATNMEDEKDMILNMAAVKVKNSKSMTLDKYKETLNLKGFGGQDIAGKWKDTRTGTALLLEHGITPDYMKAYKDTIDNLYGSHEEGKVDEIKRDFGLNTTGSVRLLDVLEHLKTGDYTDTEAQKQIDEIKNNTDYQSNETKSLNAMNEIKKAVVGLGQKTFEAKIAGMSEADKWLSKIYNFLVKDNNPFEELGLWNKGEKGRKMSDIGVDQDYIYTKELNEEFSKASGTERLELRTQVIDPLSTLSPETLAKANDKNYFNNVTSISGFGVKGKALLEARDEVGEKDTDLLFTKANENANKEFIKQDAKDTLGAINFYINKGVLKGSELESAEQEKSFLQNLLTEGKGNDKVDEIILQKASEVANQVISLDATDIDKSKAYDQIIGALLGNKDIQNQENDKDSFNEEKLATAIANAFREVGITVTK